MLAAGKLTRLGVKCCSFPNMRTLFVSCVLKSKPSYYEILGVKNTASQNEIKEAYYDLSKRYHPDRPESDEDSIKKFREVSEAYEILSNVESRKAYNKGIAITTPQPYDTSYKKFYEHRFKDTTRASAGRGEPMKMYAIDHFVEDNRNEQFLKVQVAKENKIDSMDAYFCGPGGRIRRNCIMWGLFVGIHLKLFIDCMTGEYNWHNG